MASEVAVVSELPLLPPIKTAPVRERPVEAQPEAAKAAGDDRDAECLTPKSEEHVLKPAVVCPQAPRKPRPTSRAVRIASKEFHVVPHDLTAIFLPLPPKKRIRVA